MEMHFLSVICNTCFIDASSSSWFIYDMLLIQVHRHAMGQTVALFGTVCFVMDKDVCKRGMKALAIKTQHWEDLASDRSKWRDTLTKQPKGGEERLTAATEEKRNRRKDHHSSSRAEFIYILYQNRKTKQEDDPSIRREH